MNEYFIVGRKPPSVQDISEGISLMKIDSLGNEKWIKTYDVFDPFQLYPSSIDFSSDGGFIISGSHSVLIKTDSNGNMEWNKNYDTQENIYSVRTTLDGGYIFVSTNKIFKTNSNGDINWEYQTVEGSSLKSISPIDDGGFVFLGNTNFEYYIGK